MRKRVGLAGSLMLSFALTAGVANAQVFTPTYMAPRQSSDVGVYLSDGPGEFAIEGILRRSFAGYDLGFRAGLADTDDLSVLLGADYRRPVAVGAPIDLALTGAAQGILGDRSGVGFLIGLALGYTFGAPDFAFTPYLHPRAGLIKQSEGADFDLDLLADVGVDLRFSPSLELRLGISFEGDNAEWGVGFAWR